MKLVRLGVVLTSGVGLMIWLLWDGPAAAAGAAFGALATVIQVIAVAALRPVINAPLRSLAWRWMAGTGLRLGGAAVWAGAVVADRSLFPPLPTAVGYLGVLVPLVFLEMRFLK